VKGGLDRGKRASSAIVWHWLAECWDRSLGGEEPGLIPCRFEQAKGALCWPLWGLRLRFEVPPCCAWYAAVLIAPGSWKSWELWQLDLVRKITLWHFVPEGI
jgi:hypothetical protein